MDFSMNDVILLKNTANVAVALSSFSAGDTVLADVNVIDDIPFGHKIAVSVIPEGSPVIKCGFCIGVAMCDINKGEWVHIHNLKSNYKSDKKYEGLFEK